MTRKLTRTGHVFGIASTFLAIASAQTTAVPNVSIDPATSKSHGTRTPTPKRLPR